MPSITSHQCRVRRDESGSTTVEFAIVLPAIVALLAVVLALGSAASLRVRCADAARAGARQVALGQSLDEVRVAATRVVGNGASVEVIDRGAGWVDVVVSARVGPLARLGFESRVEGRATGFLEPNGGP